MLAQQAPSGQPGSRKQRRSKRQRAELPPLDPAIPIPETPSVYRVQEPGESGWYMALVYEVDLELQQVSYLLPSGRRTIALANFASTMRPYANPIDPYRCVLNLLSRLRDGTVQMRVRDERRLVDMLSKETLNAMSERELGAEYRRIMGKGPDRISTARKEHAIEELLAKLKADAAKPSDPNAEAGTAGSPEAASAKQKRQKKEPKEPKQKEPTIRKPKTPKIIKEAAEGGNGASAPRRRRGAEFEGEVKEGDWAPRKGTMKFAAYEAFIKSGGKREPTVAAAVKAGATAATANSWYAGFCKKAAV